MKNKLGQHFLINKKIANREIDYADVNSKDIILEIGPGKGIITKLLAEKAKKVYAIELDKKLINYLSKILPDNVELIYGDALDINFKNISFNKVVSNLPFQISSPITFKLLENNFDKAILIYQKDFADRMVAMPNQKNYSNLSVHLYYKSYCELLEFVSKKSFKPQPKVDACIVKIIPLENPPFKVKNEKFFLNLSRILFNHRRKMIRTILKNNFDINLKNIPYKKERVENLTPEQIGYLSDIIFNMIHP